MPAVVNQLYIYSLCKFSFRGLYRLIDVGVLPVGRRIYLSFLSSSMWVLCREAVM